MDRGSIKRLENTHYAIERSFERLEESLKHTNEKNTNMELGNLLLWVLTADEWHKKNTVDYSERKKMDADGEVLFGLRHAYNMLKHDMICFKFHDQNVEPKFSFPLEIPEGGIEMGVISFVWAENREFDGHDNQKKVYLEKMAGQNLLNAFQSAIRFLNNEKQKRIQNI